MLTINVVLVALGLLIDSLNHQAYDQRYKSVDSTAIIAAHVNDLDEGNDVALLHNAFVAYERMDYARTDSLLSALRGRSNNLIHLLCADVLTMKKSVRTGDGVVFFGAKRKADKKIARIEEEGDDLSPGDKELFYYARTEYLFVLSTYYYYQANDSLAIATIEPLVTEHVEQHDMAQWIYLQYMLGAGGMVVNNDPKARILAEFDHLMAAYAFSRRLGYNYFQANALQALALMFNSKAKLIKEYRKDDYLTLEAHMLSWTDEGDLAMAMIDQCIALFEAYGDPFQAACAQRTRGEIHFDRGEYQEALKWFAKALTTLANRNVPEWKAQMHEKLSMTYSALGEKVASDRHRTAYLDLMEQMNQNAELSDRNADLSEQAQGIVWRMAIALLLMLAIISVYVVVLRRAKREQTDVAERLGLSRHKLETNKAANVENRAKVELVHSITPYLDRIGAEVQRAKREGHISDFSRQYITELVDQIDKHNDVLTEWVKISQGALSLHITTVDLGTLFEVLTEGRFAFSLKGIEFQLKPTRLSVKADEALTLFMINTLADNARKFTPPGGKVCIEAQEGDGYVEVSVTDTGVGLSNASEADKGFGFGLSNCRAIIDKYRKHSTVFSVCQFEAKSQEGGGSCFSFRLPRVMLLLLSFFVLPATANVEALYDSMYVCNTQGRHSEAIIYGGEALYEVCPTDSLLRMGIHNEMAVAALAVNDWELYRINDDAYRQLQKQLNQDYTLPDYIAKQEAFRYNARILLVLIIACTIAMIVLCLRLLRCKHSTEQTAALRVSDYEQQRIYVQNQVLNNALSAIKHEAMYYPSRIRQLCQQMTDADIEQLHELVSYYHNIYTILCRQADEQVEQPTFKRQTLRVVPRFPELPAPIVGDEQLINILVERLYEWADRREVTTSVTDEGRCLRFTLTVPSMQMTADEAHNLFQPEARNIPLLVAKQIIREHDINTANPGLRLYAEASAIHFTLKKAHG